jgi:hypothetical protein
MKKTIIILALILGINSNAQDKRFTISLRTELADKNTHNDKFDYGFNVGSKISYQRQIMYLDAEIYYFPNLNNMNYIHFESTLLGFNHHSWDDTWRINLGVIKVGSIYRNNDFYGLIGHEIGVEHYFKNKTFIGVKTGIDYKADSKIWSQNSTHTVYFLTIEFGLSW